MQVINGPEIYGRQAYAGEIAESRKTDSREQQGVEKKEGNACDGVKVDLSDSSREMQIAMGAIEVSPDIRTEKVEPLTYAVKTGQYRIDPGQIAEKMIGSILDEIV